MKTIHANIAFFLQLSTLHAAVSRKFDAALNGLSLSEFLVLYHLSASDGEKMRRIDLAECVGLTASGVTRMLLPMEKIGLVTKEVNAQDARSSLVVLASGGREKLKEAMDRAEQLTEEWMDRANIIDQLDQTVAVMRAVGAVIQK